MRHDHPMKPATPDACCCGPDVSSAPAPSRRALLTASAGLAAGAAALPFLSDSARAQATGANADGLLARVQGQRRILLKGGVVLTLDRGIGDFAQGDVLIEEGKIRDVRPSVAISSDDAAVIDATNRIVVPGFIDTHHHFYQGLLGASSPTACSIPTTVATSAIRSHRPMRPRMPMPACSSRRSA